MARYLVEFIGTFFLIFTIGMTVVDPGAGAMAPLAIGSVLMVMIYAGGHISGAHYNPAVTLAVMIRGRIEAGEALRYWIVQIAAGIVAALVVAYLKGDAPIVPIEHSIVPSLLAEVLFTFALCYVVLLTATTKATEGNSYFGLAIGFTVLAGAYSVGAISGGAFNPAVAVGISVLGISSWSAIWIYLVAGAIGGICAAAAFRTLHPEDR